MPYNCPDSLREFFAQRSRIDFEEELLCTIPNGRVYGTGVVLSPNGEKVARDVSTVINGIPDEHPLIKQEKLPKPSYLPGSTLNAATHGGNTYYHWLMEELPRFLEGIEASPHNVIMHRGHLQVVAEAVGYKGFIIDAYNHKHSECEALIVGHLFGRCGHPTLESINKLTTLLPMLNVPRSNVEKLYVSRKRSKFRNLTNEDQVWRWLSGMGFQRVELELMPWEQQISMFAGAKVIVSPHGAGLANIAFCQPETVLVELFNPQYVHWCYWEIACNKRLDYRPVVSTKMAPVSHELSCARSDFHIEVDHIAAALCH